MGGMEILSVWLGLGFAGSVATVWWSVRAWKRREQLNGWTKALTGIIVATAIFGSLGTVVGLIKVFGATGGESIDPSQRARIMAEGISEAMNCTAAGLLLWLPSVMALAIVTRRRKAKSD